MAAEQVEKDDKGDVDTELPRSIVKRIVKAKLASLPASGGDGAKQRDVQVNKDAVLALSESAKVFISYLTSTANDVAKERKRQTISAEDVFAALEDLDLEDLAEPLREALEGACAAVSWGKGMPGVLWGRATCTSVRARGGVAGAACTRGAGAAMAGAHGRECGAADPAALQHSVSSAILLLQASLKQQWAWLRWHVSTLSLLSVV